MQLDISRIRETHFTLHFGLHFGSARPHYSLLHDDSADCVCNVARNFLAQLLGAAVPLSWRAPHAAADALEHQWHKVLGWVPSAQNVELRLRASMQVYFILLSRVHAEMSEVPIKTHIDMQRCRNHSLVQQ